MADVTVTFEVGAQSVVVTVPDAALTRLLPMVTAYYEPFAPPGATLLQQFAAGFKENTKRDLFKYERAQARLSRGAWTPPDLTGGEEAGK